VVAESCGAIAGEETPACSLRPNLGSLALKASSSAASTMLALKRNTAYAREIVLQTTRNRKRAASALNLGPPNGSILQV